MNNFFFEKLSLLLYFLKRMKKTCETFIGLELLKLTHTVQSTHLIDFQFVGETTDNNY